MEPPVAPAAASPGRVAQLNGAGLEASVLPQTQPSFLVADATAASEPPQLRETWGGKYEFLLSCLGYCVGLGNVWRFPYLCYRNGGGSLLAFQNGTGGSIRPVSASEVFWNQRVLGMVHSSGLGDPGPVREPLALCLLLAWALIFLCTLKGIRTSGKIVYFTATFPYVVIVVLIIRGATLEGSIEGVRFYLSADWSRLQSAQVWSDAASQIFYSLGIGFGGLLSMASYNRFDNNVIRDTLVIGIGNCCTSFFAGFAIFSVLGHMAWRKRVSVDRVADSGPGLAFVAYPEALALLPCSSFWSILFFLMLLTLGVDTLLGLLLITQGGIFWFTLIDAYSTSFGLIIVALFMCLGVAFFYGVNQFCQDIVDMIRQCPPWCSRLVPYFRTCWVIVTPATLLFILFYTFLDLSSTRLQYGAYRFPPWGQALGVCMGLLSCIQIPLWAGIALFKESGTLAARFRKAIRPLSSWRSASSRELPPQVIDVPYTVNLTDSDFTGGWQLPDSSEA
ncbi:PREDICTED: sodium-dependent proline transporter-like [Thamnophis sirtalis]|uniref:Sodium-dependent proline transporter-like n=1 Tax=Thamnophis sirtalis TaxID=35019 RepID=A0A6I9Z4S2_9SAUR|nr:PREDICTED: sodium-dependent proline transporter-like [Thamnophis sirtalis]